MEILGIDVGGSGIKGGLVDIETGNLTVPRFRIPTPNPAKPRAVAEVVGEIVRHFDWHGPVGCGFPAVIQDGVAMTAANIHPNWVHKKASALFADATGCPVNVINDADAAGIAEMTFGAGKGRLGTVLIVTIGTGLGSALFTGGHLLPNTEFGHLKIRGKDAELRASDNVRKLKKMSWKKWAIAFDEFLCGMEQLVWPDLIILGGGIAKEHENYIPRLTVQTEVVPAQLLNEAGIVGAALSAQKLISG
jgi:polyphosphate glucokinase